MLKLHDIFLRKFLLLFTSVFIVLGIVFYIWIKDIYIEQTKIDLLNNIDIVSIQIKDLKNSDQKAKQIKDLIGLRVTIIDNNGVVIGESHENRFSMDNHSNRSEIIESKYEKYGSIIRYSDTLKKKLLYVSKKFTLNEDIFYIRMARDLEQINQQFLSIVFKVSFLFLFFIAISFWIALKISKRVQDETNEILTFLNAMSKQNKAIKINSTYSVEFDKITKLLTSVSQTTSKKDKQKSKYTAKLKLSNRQKDDIISAISHEFKNPIAVISGYSQTLLEDKDINPKIRERFLDKISSNSEKLTSMIDRLRLTIKLDEGKQPYNFVQCNLKTITQNVIEDLKSAYPNREIILDAPKGVNIVADETMLSIAITNLIENALKYSQDTVTVKINNKSISITDFGVGLKQKDIPKITDKFYRVSSNGWNNSLGVGLSLVRNIIDLHKFKLDIHSIENEGSTFSIQFG